MTKSATETKNQDKFWFYELPLWVRITLIVVFWWIFVPIALYPKLKNQNLVALLLVWIFVLMPIGHFVSFVALALALPSSEPTEEVAEVNDDLQKQLDEEKRLREEAEIRAKSEEEKRIQTEQLIAQATTINQEITFDDPDNKEGNQEILLAQQANTSIANLGTTTLNQKLFDVVGVVDGDTIKVSELGTLRLIGMDTPETKDPRLGYVECFGKEASNKATELLSGKKVYLEFDPSNRIDKYGRTLAYVYREDGYFFNKQMIAEGYANSYTKYPHPKMDEFNQAQEQARTSQAGLWSPNSCNGDTNRPVPQPEPAPAPQPAPQPTYTAPTPQPSYTAPAPSSGGGYVSGSCKDLNAQGLGNFRPGDPNYTASRDRDNDGIACEF